LLPSGRGRRGTAGGVTERWVHGLPQGTGSIVVVVVKGRHQRWGACRGSQGCYAAVVPTVLCCVPWTTRWLCTRRPGRSRGSKEARLNELNTCRLLLLAERETG
jgi:hypothetical protein